MSPITICVLFVVILVFVLLGLYIGINIRYFFLQREYKKEYQSRSKNILTEEEKQMLKEKHKEEARQKQEREKAKKKRERQRKKEQRKQRREEKRKISIFKSHKKGDGQSKEETVETKPDKKSNGNQEKIKKDQNNTSLLFSLKQKFQKKEKSVNLKDRIPGDTESYTSMLCSMEGSEETSDRVRENRTSQDAKYEYNKTDKKSKKKH